MPVFPAIKDTLGNYPGLDADVSARLAPDTPVATLGIEEMMLDPYPTFERLWRFLLLSG